MVDWGALDYANRLGQAEGSPVPKGILYKGIVRLIRELIAEGQLAEGDVLPPQREFAAMVGISRGTVSLAYDELRRDGIITAVPGRGSVVASDRYVNASSKKEQAIRLLTNTLDKLEGWGFSPWEIEAFMHLLLQEREGQGAQVKGVLLECSPEGLQCLHAQLGTVSHLSLSPMLLEDLSKQHEAFLRQMDLFITTEAHEAQVMAHLARVGPELAKCAVVATAPSMETWVALAKLPSSLPLAIWAHSRRFAEVMQHYVAQVGHEDARVYLSLEHLLEAAREPRGLVVPQVCVPSDGQDEDLSIEALLGMPWAALSKHFSQVVLFHYRVDRGSLLHLEEVVTSLLLQKGEGILTGRSFNH